MPLVTLSSKHQITLPMEMVRTLALKPGDKLVVELIDDHVVLLPQPESWTDYFSGSLKGVYGTTVEEIDRYIAEVRYGWDIDGLKDALAMDPDLRAVYEGTSSSEARNSLQIAQRTHVEELLALKKLFKLEELHAVKHLDDPTKPAYAYFLRIP